MTKAGSYPTAYNLHERLQEIEGRIEALERIKIIEHQGRYVPVIDGKRQLALASGLPSIAMQRAKEMLDKKQS